MALLSRTCSHRRVDSYHGVSFESHRPNALLMGHVSKKKTAWSGTWWRYLFQGLILHAVSESLRCRCFFVSAGRDLSSFQRYKLGVLTATCEMQLDFLMCFSRSPRPVLFFNCTRHACSQQRAKCGLFLDVHDAGSSPRSFRLALASLRFFFSRECVSACTRQASILV